MVQYPPSAVALKRSRLIIVAVSFFDNCHLVSCVKSKCLRLYCDCFSAVRIFGYGALMRVFDGAVQNVVGDCGISRVFSFCSCSVCCQQGELCDQYCKCKSCLNKKSKEKVRSKAIEAVLQKDPCAFQRARLARQRRKDIASGNKTTSSRCNCKKSRCLKRYCECFHRGVLCGPMCTCQQCANNHKSP